MNKKIIVILGIMLLLLIQCVYATRVFVDQSKYKQTTNIDGVVSGIWKTRWGQILYFNKIEKKAVPKTFISSTKSKYPFFVGQEVLINFDVYGRLININPSKNKYVKIA